MERLENAIVIGGELALAWSGGAETYVRLETLRRMCPCALCQGEPDVMGKVVRPVPPAGERANELVGLEPVGGYALKLRWADGHEAGIYTFDYLKKLGEGREQA